MASTEVDHTTDHGAADEGPTVGAWPRKRTSLNASDLLGRPMAEWRARMRETLGLPTDRYLVGGGHQATLWHPGIAMKTVAADEMAALTGGHSWHLVVDSDAHAIGTCAIPVRRSDGTLHEVEVSLAGERADDADVPTGRRPPFAPTVPAHSEPALPQVATGLDAIVEAMRNEVDAHDAAVQVTLAMLQLLSSHLTANPTIVRSSQLLETPLGAALLDEMRRDPLACATAYNDAIATVHGAGTPLATSPTVELPLWVLDDRGHRHRAAADDLASVDTTRLLPRALLVTALVRLAVTDLFVHGTGGIAYDTAMERWLHAWIGAVPAPASLVTATLRLPLPERDLPADAVAQAIAQRRRLWWDPLSSINGGIRAGAPARTKLEMVAEIEAAPRRSLERQRLYDAMHSRLHEARESVRDAIANAQRSVADTRRLVAGRPVALSRTWPFPFHASDTLSHIAESTRHAVRDA